MRYFLIFATLFSFVSLVAFEKLDDQYIASYGNPDAPVKITEYYSFSCPHCISLFRDDFRKIQEKYIDVGEVFWEFHPVPLDMTTVLGMACMEKLSPKERRLFLEVILEECDPSETILTAKLMKKAMEIFQKPMEDLEQEEFLTNAQAFQDAFKFIKQDDHVEAVPTVSIDGMFYPEDVPDFAFISSSISKKKGDLNR